MSAMRLKTILLQNSCADHVSQIFAPSDVMVRSVQFGLMDNLLRNGSVTRHVSALIELT